MTDQVKDRPGPWHEPLRSGPAARDAGRSGEALRAGAAELRDKAAGVTEQAKDQGRAALARQKDSAAGEVDSVAGALHDTAQRLQDDDRSTLAPKIGRYVGYAAQQLEGFGRQLRDKDLDTLVDDAARLGRRSPAALFAGAAVAGFLLSRFLKSSSARVHDDAAATQDRGQPNHDSDSVLGRDAGMDAGSDAKVQARTGGSDAALLSAAPGGSTGGTTHRAGVGGLAPAQPAAAAPVTAVAGTQAGQGERHGQ